MSSPLPLEKKPGWAALFDWDGVVIDSSRQHDLAWQKLAVERGVKLPEGFFLRSFGMKNEKAITELLGWTPKESEVWRISLRKEEIYRELISREGIATLPGVENWLYQLRAAQISCAVGSSTPRSNIECVITRLGLETAFSVMVCGEDVAHGKPDPEVFLLAAERLGVAPAHCVVFEDAHVGIAAAQAAGMKVVAVTTTHPAATLGGADQIVDRLDELTLAQINRWFIR